MKRLILTLSFIFIGLSLFGQNEKKTPYLKSKVRVGTKATLEVKPLVILKFNDEELDMGFENGEDVLSSFGAELMESIEIYKDGASTEKYGERGKNGVVLVTLKSNNDNKVLFKKLKSGEQLPSLIRTNVDVGVDNRTSFSLHPSLEVVDGIIKFKGERPKWITGDQKAIYIAVVLKGKRLILEDLKQLRPVNDIPIKSIEVIQTTESTAEQYYEQLLITLKRNPAGRKFFRKLKRAQKE